MDQKKQSGNWNIALVYYLNVSFLAVGGWIIGLVMLMIINLISFEALKDIAFPIVEWVLMWLVVMNAADYVNETYIIKDSRKIITFTMMYTVMITFPIMAIVANMAPRDSTIEELVSFVATIIGMTIVLYIASRKYLRSV